MIRSFAIFKNASIPARLQEIIYKIFSYIDPALIDNFCDFKDLLGFSLIGRAAAFINIMQVAGFKIFDSIQMRISRAAIWTITHFGYEFTAMHAFMDCNINDVIIGVYCCHFKFFFLSGFCQLYHQNNKKNNKTDLLVTLISIMQGSSKTTGFSSFFPDSF